MNKRFFIPVVVCLLLVSLVGNAQVKKVYAYKQASIPGNIIGSDDTDIKEKNDKKEEQVQNFNYWFYLSVPKKEKVAITGLWIDGRQYGIKSEMMTSSPIKRIIYTGVEKNDTTVMVPFTTNKIILVYPSGIKPGVSKNALSYARQNELVIRYSWKGKTYYRTVKKIKELPPDVRV